MKRTSIITYFHQHRYTAQLSGASDEAMPLYFAPRIKKRATALLVHGLFAYPWEMKHLGQELSRNGYEVIIPLLPGHAFSPAALAVTSYKDWINAIMSWSERISALNQHFILVGESLGAMLSLYCGAELCRIKRAPLGIISCSAAFTLPLRHHLSARIARRIHPFPKVRVSSVYRHVYMSHIASAAVRELLRLKKQVHKRLAYISCPVGVFHSKNDRSALIQGSKKIAAAVSSQQFYYRWYSGSAHVLITPQSPDYQSRIQDICGVINNMLQF